MRGRYSHVAAVMEGQVLLVASGYSGVARGDLVAYKVPLFVSSDQGDRVSLSAIKSESANQCNLRYLYICEAAKLGRDWMKNKISIDGYLHCLFVFV